MNYINWLHSLIINDLSWKSRYIPRRMNLRLDNFSVFIRLLSYFLIADTIHINLGINMQTKRVRRKLMHACTGQEESHAVIVGRQENARTYKLLSQAVKVDYWRTMSSVHLILNTCELCEWSEWTRVVKRARMNTKLFV